MQEKSENQCSFFFWKYGYIVAVFDILALESLISLSWKVSGNDTRPSGLIVALGSLIKDAHDARIKKIRGGPKKAGRKQGTYRAPEGNAGFISKTLELTTRWVT
jgi:hypothetical protein